MTTDQPIARWYVVEFLASVGDGYMSKRKAIRAYSASDALTQYNLSRRPDEVNRARRLEPLDYDSLCEACRFNTLPDESKGRQSIPKPIGALCALCFCVHKQQAATP